MIVGNGLLARSLKEYDRPDFLFIAAGVSDSKCTDPLEFDRERELVKSSVQDHLEKTIIFFSTFSVNDPVMAESPYVKCKLELEDYVRRVSMKCLVIRISNLVGEGGNPMNIFNFFFNQIVSGNRFKLWANSRRNLIMEKDFVRILNYILDNELPEKLNKILNIVNIHSYSVMDIVTAIERHIDKKAVYDVVEIESIPQETDEHSMKMFELLQIDTQNYLQRILEHYFSKTPIVNSV